MSIRKPHGLRLQTSIVQDSVPVEVASGLFVGSIHSAFNVEALKSNKISHVLNLAGSYATFPEDFTYLSLSIRDKEFASLLSCLPVAAVFIDAGLKNGGVLIHCAGGRSRSPAVAMAFLIMKQQMSYSSISAHVKALRPVVSLNVGFDAQLKCLETARGDVFVANQHFLKARLTRLAQQHMEGELVGEVAKKRRQLQQQPSSQSSEPPLMKKQSSIEMLVSGCDDRGMIGERVPIGFYLSTPPCSKIAATKVPVSSFIPALRSMGTVYGCQSCGESLFCAGAIVHHHEMTKLNACSGENESTRFLSILRGQVVNDSTADSAPGGPICEDQAVVASGESITKTPLLAKLRLRPHSPSVTLGNGPHIVSCADTSINRRKSASPVLTKPNIGTHKGDEEAGTGFQSTRRPATEENKRTGSVSPCKADGEPKKKSGGGLWRSLKSLKGSKRTAKATIDDASCTNQLQNRTGVFELQKPGVPPFAMEDHNASAVGHLPAHLVFLKHNAVEWQRCVQQLEMSGGSTIDQVAALVHEDSAVLVALDDCNQWFVEPQLWTIDQAKTHPEGEIRCPREACGVVVGEWRWEGLSNSCGGGSIAPAFVMKRDAVCVLGNMTSQSTELLALASSETPEK